MNARAKGKRGELDWAAFCRETWGLSHARRGRQHHGGPEAPDTVDVPGCRAEVKRVEALNLAAALAQSIAEAAEGEIPYVAHRRNRQPWLVTLRAEDLPQMAVRLLAAMPDSQRAQLFPGREVQP